MRSDRGQAVLMVAVVVVLVAIVALGLAHAADVVLERQHAQTAADAAALAGVQGGRPAAARLAAANGATLVSFVQEGATVTVVVATGEVRARARASNGP
ncbi:MAG: hypothetical protein HZB15_06685 [Actinobacteria bacterium]|nr:hypothetical protein [Actinomycetota bacterium]